MNCAMFLFALFLFFPHASGAGTPPEAFLLDRKNVMTAAAAVTADRFPNADRVLVDNRVLERYERDGTSVVWDDEYSKILTEKGRREASSVRIPFNAHYGTSLVHRAEIIKPDGRIIALDIASYARVMVESEQMGANIYDPNNKTLSLSLPGLEPGDVCHLITCRITFKARMPDTWSDYAVFEYDSPIVRLEYAISAPPDLPFRHALLRAPVPGTVAKTERREADGRTLHLWTVTDVPQMYPEPDMPPPHTQVQRLLLSTIPDWRTVSRWYWELCAPALAATNAAMRTRVDALIAGANTREERVRRIFKFVSQEIRYMGITAEDTAPGYEPHAVSLTFDNRYGVCRDKAALLVALLRMAGIAAYPVLIHAGAKMDPDVPVPFFNHAVTAVDSPGGGYLLMDPTDENTRDLFPAYLCNRSYLVARPEGETLRVSDVYPAEKNLTRIETEGTLDRNGSLLLKTRIRFEGINDNAYRGHLVRQKPEQRRNFFEAALKNRLPGAEVIECVIAPEDLRDTETPLAVTLTSRVPEFPVRGEGLDLLALPWLGTGLGYANFVIGQTGLDKRRYPLETGITCGTEERVSLHAAAGLGAPHTLPAEVRIDRAGVFFAMRQSVSNTVLSGSLTYHLKTPEFSPSDYLELKRILREIEFAGRKRPLFEAGDPNPPDQETLHDITETRLVSPHAWTTIHTWSRRVLTYAGKKNNSELKIPFNPVWQQVDLLAATVSNANGTVHTVTSKEMNRMDAAWTGSAPRYPAGKLLVVNLPGVETGSVITVTTRFTQTNAPFYCHTHTFGGTAPVAEAVYRLIYPDTLNPAIRLVHPGSVTAGSETRDGLITRTWHAPRQPVTRTEEMLPPWHFFRPTLFVSFGDWPGYARLLRRAAETAADTDRAARRRAKELVRGLRDPRERLLAVRDEVLRTIRPAGPAFLDLPPDCLSPPDRTLADQYGHPADRALLLRSMLRAAGFDAELLFAGQDTTRYPAFSQPMREIPQIGFYSHPLVAVRLRDGICYLNEGDQYSEPGSSGLEGAPALTLRGRPVTIELDESLRNRSHHAWTIDLDASGSARITVSNRFFGTQAGTFRKQYREMLPEERRRHHLELVSAIAHAAEPASALITETEGYPCVRTHTVTAARYATREGRTLTLLIPEVAGILFPLRADSRVNPLFLGMRDTSDLTCEILLPPGYTRLPVLPESKHWTLPNGLGTLDYSVKHMTRADGRVQITITRALARRSAELPAELYPALLEYNRRLAHPATRTLVAERPAALQPAP